MITETTIPTAIRKFFNRLLLSAPIPKTFDASNLEELFKYALYQLNKKCKPGTKAYLECEQLINQYKEVYERIAQKEKERETEKSYACQTPFYSPEISFAIGRAISWRFRQKRRARAYKCRSNNEV